MATIEPAKGILSGIRVLDWTVIIFGPTCGAMLADLGAEVIHLEERERGELLRGHRVSRGVEYVTPSGQHCLFEELNRGKKSLGVDLRTSAGREVVYRLVQKCDVFLTNYRLEAINRYGMDYDTLRQQKPNLIYALGTALGEKGTDAHRPGVEDVAFARSGLMMNAGQEGDPPVRIPAGMGDRTAGVYLAYGIVSALLARERYGVGQKVSVSLLGSLLDAQFLPLTVALWTGKPYPRFQRAKARNPIYNHYECQDGEWIMLACPWSDKLWPAACQALGIPEIEKEPRFATATQRSENNEELVALLDKVFGARTAAEWEQILAQYPDILFGRVQDPQEAISDSQALDNAYISDWVHPLEGQVRSLGNPVNWSVTPAAKGDRGPQMGEHTEEILTELCGYDWEDIQELQRQRAI